MLLSFLFHLTGFNDHELDAGLDDYNVTDDSKWDHPGQGSFGGGLMADSFIARDLLFPVQPLRHFNSRSQTFPGSCFARRATVWDATLSWQNR